MQFDLEFAAGSSPLTRGKQRIGLQAEEENGLIPAHAGKTARDVLGAALARAHPRSRGENDNLPACTSGWEGSSPLTRGKHVEVGHGPEGHGLIPAHAGKTYWANPVQRPCWAHPRSRGENASAAQAGGGQWGSSPLTRGKRLAVVVQEQGKGLIPAHAGKTHSWSIARSVQEAHPRSRGENLASPGRARPSAGSSPLTRGKHGEPGVGVL